MWTRAMDKHNTVGQFRNFIGGSTAVKTGAEFHHSWLWTLIPLTSHMLRNLEVQPDHLDRRLLPVWCWEQQWSTFMFYTDLTYPAKELKQRTMMRTTFCGLVVRVPGYRSGGPGFAFRRYQIFWQVVGLERGPLEPRELGDFNAKVGREDIFKSPIGNESLHATSNDNGVKVVNFATSKNLTWPRDTLYPQKLAPTSPTSGGRSVGIIRSRTKTTEFVCLTSALP
jgi:hypothetical protein